MPERSLFRIHAVVLSALLLTAPVACTRSRSTSSGERFPCPLLHLPPCPPDRLALYARDVEKWGPILTGADVTVRGRLRLGDFPCQETPEEAMDHVCSRLRRDRLGLFLGPIYLRPNPWCKCYREGGSHCPVPMVAEEVVMVGTYRLSEGVPELGSSGPKHMLNPTTSCRVTPQR